MRPGCARGLTAGGPINRLPSTSTTTSARLFFALWPDPHAQAALATAADSAIREGEQADAGVRRVPAENFHLTLAFLGSVPLSRLVELEETAGRCAVIPRAQALPIEIVLNGIEYWRKPQILCATSSGAPESAVALAESLKQSLIAAGFTPDLKPFRVHATVARKVRRITGELHIEPVRWTFDSIHLVESRTGPAGSTYSTLKKWVLDKRD
jgi:RNA 2',3'-cyclic 3'-phosphodiesterase